MDSREFSSLGIEPRFQDSILEVNFNFNSSKNRFFAIIICVIVFMEKVSESKIFENFWTRLISRRKNNFFERTICENFIRKSTNLESIEFDQLQFLCFSILVSNLSFFVPLLFLSVLSPFSLFLFAKFHLDPVDNRPPPPFYRIFSPTPTFLQRLLFPLVSLFFLSSSLFLHLFRPILLILSTSSLNIIPRR